ncbi:DNA polymerase III subunit gamma/tau [Haemophilus haemolyticus]|jgi:DNA polymerase III, subunit gamma and tau|uniref:DNA polymerase III subunit gamma/tau n=1 Tax=Haemophilus TaxID=724 RepID=UPI000DACCE2C|nr:MULTISPECIES: DNA polymerase III subunit gamma/tau [Haemophilus]UJZ89661.1 DNA polymerase III subunit gamma/tau [Haemophilus seminalis]MBS5999097.1 DNA polymerase III subunit gamma/tau [Haemophilus haemolyticus]RDE69442.1 DNA polymerase III subunit gamma/tau [Haemophilus haemolyticus]TPH06793.1 DNA polymerase III subunit gamma/tau [Haemophilus haemolyticus]TPH27208.1 DNA polymerase III subunit gamma/tau [Haemophilus haemolyticus]
MSYQVLARKWRPKTFADVVGQEHIITALANGLKDNRLHHSYLFSGTRGVGKTSIARLFAKGLNCVHGVTATPCGECENCKAIEQGNFIDLIEIDAASRTKVEDTRELLDNVQYKPVVGRFKVYLIDEVHMLSRHSFNALLKTLEEPPEYVKFLLATTDPQKLPVTILSRCLQFHLKALDETQISQHLAHILTQENIPFEEPALIKLAKAAQGSIRDSLSLTDQAIAMGDRQVTNNVVSNMLGLLDDNCSIDILYALHQGNGELLMRTLQKVADAAGDWDKLLGECAEKLHQIALMQLLPQKSSDDNEHFSFLAKHISPEDVQFFYQVIVSGRKDLSNAPNRRIGTEMTLLRALAFHPKFLTAVQKANTTIIPPPSTPSAVENAGNYVNVPVLSQSIKSAYSQAKSNKTGIPNLASFSALDALEHLTQLENQERQEHKAESLAAVSETLHHIQELDEEKSNKKMTALPVREMSAPKLKNEKLSSFSPQIASMAKDVAIVENSMEDNAEIMQEEREILDAETYRWEWSNPELAKADTGVRPSDIKQAILKDITPELRLKIITQTQQQDEWADIVERSGVTGFSKELALNCFLQSKTDDEINLGLHSEKSHLRQERSIKHLTEALSKLQGKAIHVKINIDDSSVTTPMEYRRNIYQTLREQARAALQQDNKILLLQKEFDAKLDVESIRPV